MSEKVNTSVRKGGALWFFNNFVRT